MASWKGVFPRLKKFLGVGAKKKAAAAEATKFESSKESIDKEIEEKEEELRPKVVEIWNSLDAATKKVVKDPTAAALKKNSKGVQKLLEELAKIGFPGASDLSEATTKYGVTLLSEPVIYELQKVAALAPPEEEPKPAEEESKEVVAESREVEITPETVEAAPAKTEETPAPAAAAAPPPVTEKAAEESSKQEEVKTVESVEASKEEEPKKTTAAPAAVSAPATATATEPAKPATEAPKA